MEDSPGAGSTSRDTAGAPLSNPFTALLTDIPPPPPRRWQQLPGLSLPPLLASPLGAMALLILAFFTVAPAIITTVAVGNQGKNTMVNANGRVLQVAQHPVTRQSQLNYTFKTKTGEIYYNSMPLEENSPLAHVKHGDPLTIEYAADDPLINNLTMYKKRPEPLWVAFIVMPLMGCFLAVFLLGPTFLAVGRPLLQARRIFSRGVITHGATDFIKARSLGPVPNTFPGSYIVLYSFVNETSQTVKGEHACDNHWLIQRLEVGMPITVAYLPKQSRKSIFLEPYIA